MPLVSLKPYIEDADKKGYAIGCFNIINLESLDGVIKAGENLNSPVCVTFHPPHFKYTDIEVVASAVKTAASKTQIPIMMHLDNATDTSQVIDAIKFGFTSIMYIGTPDMDFKTKVDKTKCLSEIAHSAGLMFEADACLKNNITKPLDTSDNDYWNNIYIESVKEFCQQTNIDILSVNIIKTRTINGNKETTIDFDLLNRIKTTTKKYLSLHGGSGVPDDILKKAFKLGIDKMHIYARSANKALSNIKSLINVDNSDLIEVMQGQRIGFREIVETCINLFGSANKALNLELVNTITDAVLKNIKTNF